MARHSTAAARDKVAEPGKPQLTVDLHSHTEFSWDGLMSPAALVRRARECRLDRIAITDHHEVDGALRARDLAPDLVIVGEEIRCACGSELIGLFLEERIPPRLPASEVAQRIHEQGGLVYAPHPFAYLSRAAERASRVLALADICEVFNSRAFLDTWNRRSLAMAEHLRLPPAAASDAHLPWEIGRAYTVVPWFQGPAELLTSLHQGVLHRIQKGTVLSHVVTLTRGVTRLGCRLVQGDRGSRLRHP